MSFHQRWVGVDFTFLRVCKHELVCRGRVLVPSDRDAFTLRGSNVALPVPLPVGVWVPTGASSTACLF